MIQSSRLRTVAAALAGVLCVGTLTAQFAGAQSAAGAPVLRTDARPLPVRRETKPAGVVLDTRDPDVAKRAIAALRTADPTTYHIETTDPKTGRQTVLGSLSPDVVERTAGAVSSPAMSAGRPRIRIMIFIYIRSMASEAARERLSAALRGVDQAAYSLTEVK